MDKKQLEGKARMDAAQLINGYKAAGKTVDTTVDFLNKKVIVVITSTVSGNTGATTQLRGVSRCNHTDEFNVHICTIIAVYRALGVPVPQEYLSYWDTSAPVEQAPAGHVPAGHVPAGQVPVGQVPVVSALLAGSTPVKEQTLVKEQLTPVVKATIDTVVTDAQLTEVFSEFKGNADSMAKALVLARRQIALMATK